MASQKNLDNKQKIIDEIASKVKDASSFVLFDYQGLTVSETNELRKSLRESGSEFKIYKNTLTKRALDTLNIDLDEHLNGPKAFAFGSDAVAPIKALKDFSKQHEALKLQVGIVDGEIVDQAKLNELAAIPSREGLLTMLAGGLIGVVRDLSICLDLYSQDLEK